MKLYGSRHPLATAMVLSVGLLAGTARADETCELNDGDPTTHEFAGGATAAGAGATACGPMANASGDGSTAFGVFSESLGIGSVANGSSSRAFGDFSTAIGSATRAESFATALGFSSIAAGDSSTAVGGWFDLNADGLFALDEVTHAGGDRSIAIGAAAQATGIGSAAFGFHSSASASLSTTTGYFSQASGFTSTANGTNSLASADYSTAMGGRSQATAEGGTALGNSSRATAAGSVAVGYLSIADRAGTVSVGTAGGERQIVNVAAGTQLTDAVNLSQLQATLITANAYTDTAVATGGTATNAYTDNREAAIRTDMDAGDAATLSSANAYTDTKVAEIAGFAGGLGAFRNEVNDRFVQQDKRISRIGAMGTAMAQMSASAAGIRKQNRLAVGTGMQAGHAALAVGYQRALSDSATFTLGGAFSGDGEDTVGMGMGIGW